MKKYEINIFSNKIAVLSALILVVFASEFAVLISDKFTKLNTAFIILLFFALAYFGVRFLSKGKIVIELTENSFKHTWIKKFLFSSEIDIELEWDDILNHGGGFWQLHEYFQLDLNNNKKYRIYRWAVFSPKDDFRRFEKEFSNYLNSIKKLKKINQE